MLAFPAQMALNYDPCLSFRGQVEFHTRVGQRQLFAGVGNVNGCQSTVSARVLVNSSEETSWCREKEDGLESGGWGGPALAEPLPSRAEPSLGALHTLSHSILQNTSG